MKSRSRPFIPEIDEIRALAALLVLFYHGFQLIGAHLTYGASFDPAAHWVIANNPLVALIEEGHTGVGLFIVLSGFILSLGVIGRDIDYSRFLLARAARLYPLLVVLLAVSVVGSAAPVTTFIMSLVPLPGIAPPATMFTSMFWAVMVEFQCYLLFPFLLLFARERGASYLGLLVLTAIALRLLLVLAADASPRDITYWTILGRIDQFIIGIALAHFVVALDPEMRRGRMAFPFVALLVLMAVWLLNRLGGWPADGVWKILSTDIEGLIWAAFIYTFVPFSRKLSPVLKRPLLFIGLISYPFYLLHFAIISMVINLGWYVRIFDVGYYDALLTTALVVVPITVSIAWLLHQTVERPFLTMRPNYLRA